MEYLGGAQNRDTYGKSKENDKTLEWLVLHDHCSFCSIFFVQKVTSILYRVISIFSKITNVSSKVTSILGKVTSVLVPDNFAQNAGNFTKNTDNSIQYIGNFLDKKNNDYVGSSHPSIFVTFFAFFVCVMYALRFCASPYYYSLLFMSLKPPF